MIEKFDSDDPEQVRRIQAFMGPQQVDNQIRQAMQICWMALPEGRRNVDGVEQEMRRIFERALRDLREDFDSFGLAPS